MAENKNQSQIVAIRSLKSEMRRHMKKIRAAAFAENEKASFELRDQFLKTLPLPSGAVVASYYALGSEIDPLPLTDALREKGHIITLPVIVHPDEPLLFKIYATGTPLLPNRYGIGEPDPRSVAIEPDILLVPLLAFDRRGTRLGAGAGYYDRTLQALRAKKPILAIGLAFSDQEVPQVPLEDHDVALDRIATEIQVFNPPATVRA